MHKRIFAILYILLSVAGLSNAQTVRIQAQEVCEVGQKIKLCYIVDTQDVEDIQVGEFPGFEYLYGPSTSSQSSTQWINGKTTHTSSITFTYTLLAKKEGEYQLPSATIKLSNKTIRSNTASVTVLPSTSNSNATGSTNPSSSHSQRPGAGSVDSRDLFITASVNKTKVFEQEAVLLTYKLYTLVNIRQLSGDMPELDGFHCQELNSKAQLSLKYENYNGRNYGTAIWRQYVLFPQKSGKLTIPSVSFDAEIVVTNHSADPFDFFFGGGSLTQIVNKTIKTPKVDIDVQSLPAPAPPSFSGSVGNFKMSATLSPEQLNANDAATLKLVISGHGNMKLMKAPAVNAPKDFELYAPKETTKTTTTSAGAKGSITFDYVIVPRHGGKYSIPPVEFVYFNSESKQYVTLKTDTFHLSVAKGNTVSTAESSVKEDVRILSSDIHYIKTGRADISENKDAFFATKAYYLIHLGLVVVFVSILLLFRRYAKLNSDTVRKRGRQAGKQASKRLKQAHKLLKKQQVGEFYEELLRALLNYVSDKMNIPMTDLTKENVSEALSSRGVDDSLIKQYMDVIESCEFARFAPGDPLATMDKIYESASNAINNLDKNL